MTGNCQVRCGAGENSEITSKNYLSLFGEIPNFDKLIATIRSREISASIILQCIVEFIHGNGFLPACVAVSGNYGLYNWNGLDLGADIESIKMINYGDTVEY